MTHYETLGVAQSATPDEIKSAYRKLAKQHHPDLGGDITKFQQISEAYETLSNDQNRAHYDYQLRNPQPQGFPPGFEMHMNGHPFAQHSDIFNHLNEHLFTQFGFGARQPQRNRNIRINLELDLLDTLNPHDKVIEYKTASGMETISINFPPGIHDGQIISLQGRGDNAIANAPRGNLEIVVHVKPNKNFYRINQHVYSDITIDCFDAMIGKTLVLHTPMGKTIELTIPAGTQNSTQFGITDEGFPIGNGGRGKFIVKVSVLIPTVLTDEQKTLVKQIQKLKPINT